MIYKIRYAFRARVFYLRKSNNSPLLTFSSAIGEGFIIRICKCWQTGSRLQRRRLLRRVLPKLNETKEIGIEDGIAINVVS